MRKKILRNLFTLSALTIFVTSLLIFGVMYRQVYDDRKEEVKKEANYIAIGINMGGTAFLDSVDQIKPSLRITLIDTEGAVQYDNMEVIEKMVNHKNRVEVEQATTLGYGEAVRESETMGKQTFYYAVRLDNGNIIRVANTTESILFTLLGLTPFIVMVFIFIIFLAFLIAKRQTRNIIDPINNINLEIPLLNNVYEEFSPLLRKIEAQNKQIEEQIHQIKKQQREFLFITENMNEGLLVLDAKGNILSINQSACHVFEKEKSSQGRYFLWLNRSLGFKEVIEKGLSGMVAEERLKENGRCYQLMATPIKEGEQVRGVVLLILDITEKEEGERLRQEFSSNVSHELKTPLTSISGYAEIIQNGIAKKEDIPRFATHIYKETARLITLVEDIIELSRLDEKNIGLAWEDVDLYELCQESITRLGPVSEKAEVNIFLEGESAMVQGVKPILSEMIGNLCDNAIKYNHAGGKVFVRVIKMESGARVVIADTGIGIPISHQSRIFERFYRVDKSHSKETGGTGLGLSIVKYAAKYHDAKIGLESADGKGTKFTIDFPRLSSARKGLPPS